MKGVSGEPSVKGQVESCLKRANMEPFHQDDKYLCFAGIQVSLATSRFERIAVMQGCNRMTVQTGATIPQLMFRLECQSRVSLILRVVLIPLG